MATSTRAEAACITDDQRAFYDENGYLLLESFVDEAWLQQLRAASAEFVELSRELTSSNRVLDVEPTHTAEAPRLRRLIFWASAAASIGLIALLVQSLA